MASAGAVLSAALLVLVLRLMMEAATVAHCQELGASFMVINLINEDLDLSPNLLVTCGRAAPASFDLTAMLPIGSSVSRHFKPDASGRTTWYCEFVWTARSMKAQDFIVWADPRTARPPMTFRRNTVTLWQATARGLVFQTLDTPASAVLLYQWRDHR